MSRKKKVINLLKAKENREMKRREESLAPGDETLIEDEDEVIKDKDAFLERLARLAKTLTIEREMGIVSDRIYKMALETQPKMQRTGVDLYTTWHKDGGCYRVFLICFKCLVVWSPIIRTEDTLPEDFGLCPKGCNKDQETYSVATSDIVSNV